jgi:hypothetical protein
MAIPLVYTHSTARGPGYTPRLVGVLAPLAAVGFPLLSLLLAVTFKHPLETRHLEWSMRAGPRGMKDPKATKCKLN